MDEENSGSLTPKERSKICSGSRECSLRVISAQRIGSSQENQTVYESLQDKENIAYYSYLKSNYTTIDQIVYSTSKSLLGKRNKKKTLVSTENSERLSSEPST